MFDADPESRAWIGDSIHPRVARIKLAETRDYLAHLHRARQHALALGLPTEQIERLLRTGQGLADRYARHASETLDSRRRFGPEKHRTRNDPRRNQYMLCLDECGSYDLSPATDAFPVFCV